MLTQEQLKEIRERAEKATPGPWEIRIVPDGRVVAQSEDHYGDPEVVARVFTSQQWQNDPEFVAASRTDIPLLLDEITRLQDEIQSIRQRVHQGHHEGTEAACRKGICADVPMR